MQLSIAGGCRQTYPTGRRLQMASDVHLKASAGAFISGRTLVSRQLRFWLVHRPPGLPVRRPRVLLVQPPRARPRPSSQLRVLPVRKPPSSRPWQLLALPPWPLGARPCGRLHAPPSPPPRVARVRQPRSSLSPRLRALPALVNLLRRAADTYPCDASWPGPSWPCMSLDRYTQSTLNVARHVQLYWRLGQGADHGRMARVAEAWDRPN